MKFETPNRTTKHIAAHNALIQRDPKKRIPASLAPETDGMGYLTVCEPQNGSRREYALSTPGAPVRAYICENHDHVRHLVYLEHDGADVYSVDITEWGDWAKNVPDNPVRGLDLL